MKPAVVLLSGGSTPRRRLRSREAKVTKPMPSHSPTASVTAESLTLRATWPQRSGQRIAWFSHWISARSEALPRRAFPRRGRCARDRVLHPGRLEGGSPALLVVAGQLKIVALARHASLDVADAPPRVQPRAEGPQHGHVGVHANGFRRDEEQAAEAVSHALRVRGSAEAPSR